MTVNILSAIFRTLNPPCLILIIWTLNMDALVLHRIQFAFTITFHYLFPQLTMGLALLILILKTIGIMHNRPVSITTQHASGRESSR